MSEQMKGTLAVADNPGLAILEQVMAAFEAMSDEERFALSVRAGIHRPDGRLTPAYGGADDEKSIVAA